MTDEAKALVERLRTKYCCSDWDKGCNCEASADLIETQAREIKRLREALRNVPLPSTMGTAEEHYRRFYGWYKSARAALGDSHDA